MKKNEISKIFRFLNKIKTVRLVKPDYVEFKHGYDNSILDKINKCITYNSAYNIFYEGTFNVNIIDLDVINFMSIANILDEIELHYYDEDNNNILTIVFKKFNFVGFDLNKFDVLINTNIEIKLIGNECKYISTDLPYLLFK